MRKWKLMIIVAVASAMFTQQADAAVINVAPFGIASQSTTNGGFTAGRATDGIKTGINPDFTHTISSDSAPTWTLDLTQALPIESIDIYNRTDCCGGRLRDITVEILDTDGTTVLYDSGLLNAGNSLGGGLGDYATGPASPWTITPPATTNGQFVRISRTIEGNASDDQAVLALSEVEVFAEFTPPENIALGKSATQSTTLGGFVADLGTDGNLGNFTHTLGTDAGASWQVNLDGDFLIDEIVVFNRSSCCGERLRDITVEVLDANESAVWQSELLNPENGLNSPANLTLDLADFGGSALEGSFVKILRTSDPDNSGFPTGNADDSNVLSLGEVQVFGTAVPEPSSFMLIGIALLGLRAFRFRQQRSGH